MAQFDVYENKNINTKEQVPYFLDIQNDLLKSIGTRVVIPLIKDVEIFKNLNPTFVINEQKYILSTQEMTYVSTSYLGKHVISLEEQRTEILNAIDFLITGF